MLRYGPENPIFNKEQIPPKLDLNNLIASELNHPILEKKESLPLFSQAGQGMAARLTLQRIVGASPKPQFEAFLTEDHFWQYMKRLGVARSAAAPVIDREKEDTRFRQRVIDLEAKNGLVPSFSDFEVQAVWKDFNQGVVARNKIVEHNRRLVDSVALLFQAKDQDTFRHIDRHDFRAEGEIGLYRAIAKFDYTSSTAFSTYAWPWIYQAINSFWTHDKEDFSVPDDFSGHISTVSLEAPVGPDDSDLWVDLIPSKEPTPHEQVETVFFMPEAVKLAFSNPNLTKAERKVLSLRFGFEQDSYNEEGKLITYDKIGQKMGGVSRQRVKELELLGLKKLRDPSFLDSLKKIYS